MSLLKDFDLAIADIENIPRGFVTNKGNYDSYISNAAWVLILQTCLQNIDPSSMMAVVAS